MHLKYTGKVYICTPSTLTNMSLSFGDLFKKIVSISYTVSMLQEWAVCKTGPYCISCLLRDLTEAYANSL